MKEREDDAPLLAALSALPRDEAPPAELEERVLTALRAEGLVRPRGARRALPAFLALAAALILFAAGIFVGRLDEPRAAPASRYVLLLYRGEMKPPASAEEEAVFVREYTNWMREQAASGLLVDGEKLGDASRLVGWPAGPTEAPDLLGYFIVGAASLDEAEAIARAHPHAKHGGLVVVKEIVSR